MEHPLLNKPEDESKVHPLLRTPKIYGVGTTGYVNPQMQGLDKLERYTPYNVQLSPFLDLNEQRAQNQTTAEKWKNGAAKMFTTAGGAFVEGTAGIVAGLIEATKQRDFTAFYDNSVGRSVDRYKEKIRDQFPNYYTQQEQKAEGWASLGYANFWADKTLDGVGYMLGTIASTAATAGMGKLIGGAASNALRAYKVTKIVDSAADVAKLTNASIRLSKGLDAAGQATIGLMSAFAESSMEARQILNDETKKLKSKYAAELGVAEYDLPKDVLAKIKDEASAAANIGFILNSVVTGANNLVIFRNAMLPGFRTAKANSKNFKFNVKTNQWEDVWSSMNKADKFITRFGVPMVESGISEAFQEGTQNVIAEKASEFATAGSVSDLFESLSEGYGSLFNTKEGKESMLIGAIVGMLSAGAGGLRRTLSSSMNAAEQERNKNILSVINNPDLFNFTSKAQRTQANIDLAAEMQRALENGDHKKYRDIQAELLLGETLFHLENGTMDLFLEQIEDESLKDDAEFIEHYGIPAGMSFNKAEHLSGIKERVQKIAELKEKIDIKFPGPRQLSKDELEKLSDEEKMDYTYAQNEHNIFTSTILRNNFRLEDADARIENMSLELNDLAGKSVLTPKDALLKPVDEASPTKRVLFTMPVEQSDGNITIQRDEQWNKLSQKLFDAYEELKDTNPQKADEFLTLSRDMLRLAESRAESVYALNNLLTDPKKRESYLAREKQKEDAEAQRQRDAIAREKLNNAKTSNEVQNILNNQTPGNELSDEFKVEAAKKQTELRLKENQLEQESLSLSLDELKARRDASEDEVEKSMLTNIIQQRQQSGQFDPPVPPSPSSEDNPNPFGFRPEDEIILKEEEEEEIAEMQDVVSEYNVSSDEFVPQSEVEIGYNEEFDFPEQPNVTDETLEFEAEEEGKEQINPTESIVENVILEENNDLNLAEVQEQVYAITYILNKANSIEDALQELYKTGKLVQVEGNNLFDVVEGRDSFILNLNGVRIPIYRSSRGTSSKTQGNWYVYFFPTKDWLAKGLADNYKEGYGNEALTEILAALNAKFLYDEPRATAKVNSKNVLKEILPGADSETLDVIYGLDMYSVLPIAVSLMEHWAANIGSFYADGIRKILKNALTTLTNQKNLSTEDLNVIINEFNDAIELSKKLDSSRNVTASISEITKSREIISLIEEELDGLPISETSKKLIRSFFGDSEAELLEKANLLRAVLRLLVLLSKLAWKIAEFVAEELDAAVAEFNEQFNDAQKNSNITQQERQKLLEIFDTIQKLVTELKASNQEEVSEEVETPVEDNLPEVVVTDQTKETNDRTRVPQNQITINNGEIKTLRVRDENGNYVYSALVSNDNELSQGFDANHVDLNGTPFNIDRSFIKNTPKEEVLAGSVKLKLLETQWSKNQKEAGTLTGNNIPIGVYLTTENSNGEVLIGLLPIETYNRETIAADLAAGKNVEGKITNIVATSQIRTVDSNNQSVYFPANEIIEDLQGEFEFGVAESRGDNVQGVTFGRNNDIINPDFLEQASFLTTKASPGRVVLVSNRPGEGLGVTPLTTASMDARATQTVLDLIKEDANNVVELVKNVVGTKTALDPKSVFSIEQTAAKKANGFVYFPSSTGAIIKASTTALSKALKGEPYRISIGELVPWTIENAQGEEDILLNALGEPKFIFKSTLPTSESEDPEEKKRFAIEQGKMINQIYKPTLLSDLESAIKQNRRQVDLTKLRDARNNRQFTSPVTNITYPNYLEYLSSDKELETPQGAVKSILSTNSKAYNGSMYADVGVNISIFENVDPAEVKMPDKKDIVNPSNKPKTPVKPVTVDVGFDFDPDELDLGADIELGADIKNNCKGK